MPLIDNIAALQARADLTDDQRRRQLYVLKVSALLEVVASMIGQTIEHQDFMFCINGAHATKHDQLALDVTFTRPPDDPVTHQIFITNPPVLPRDSIGNEKEDLITAVREMLEGFV